MGSGGSTGGGWPAQLVVIIKSCRHFFSSTGQKLEERGEELEVDSCRQQTWQSNCLCGTAAAAAVQYYGEYELAAITSWKGNAVNWVVLAKNNTESCYSWCDRSGCSD